MIVDKISNAHLYSGISPAITRALTILSDPVILTKSDGRYEVDADIYYLIKRYTTKPIKNAGLEAHTHYIDIQVVLDGQEAMGYAHIDNLTISKPYDTEKERVLYVHPADMSLITLKKGMFSIVFPEDAYAPAIGIKGALLDVHKLIIKVRLDSEPRVAN
jgi:biofilm protein TabA